MRHKETHKQTTWLLNAFTMLSGRPSVRPCAWRNISVHFNDTFLALPMRSKHRWKGCQGHRSKVKVMMMWCEDGYTKDETDDSINESQYSTTQTPVYLCVNNRSLGITIVRYFPNSSRENKRRCTPTHVTMTYDCTTSRTRLSIQLSHQLADTFNSDKLSWRGKVSK